MSNELIEEGNKRIAIFDGYRVVVNHPDYEWACCHHPTLNINCYAAHQLEYHTSWDWLMPVVEKIEKLGYDTGICKVKIKGELLSEVIISPVEKDGKIEIHSRQLQSKIILTWKTVIQFIQWYNV